MEDLRRSWSSVLKQMKTAPSVKLSGALNALSESPDGTQVVVAGREILRILNIQMGIISESVNLRSGAKSNLNVSSTDGSNYLSWLVKWCHLQKQLIATSATNGAVVIWDVHRATNKQERVISEHMRAVNRIAFHPTNPVLLLSASQDGTRFHY